MLDFLLIGSSAAEASGLNREQPRDKDFIVTPEYFMSIPRRHKEAFYPTSDIRWVSHDEFGVTEYEVALPGSSGEALLKMATTNCATPEMLLALKLSHRYLRDSPHFKKTMDDILFFRSRGVELTPELEEWVKQREKETYTYAHPKLNQSKESFFSDDGVRYVVDHDALHEIVKMFAYPAYTYYKAENEEVKCSEQLWNECSVHVKLAGVYEEACVLALERSYIPFREKWNPEKAFLKALEKVCTSITSGWFREFAYDNYYKVASMYNETSFYYYTEEVEKLLVNAKAD